MNNYEIRKQQLEEKISKYWFEEGHLNIDQRDYFIEILMKIKPKYCLEIGFASGRSSAVVLVVAQPEVLVSIEISLDYIQGSREHASYLQQEFPNLRVVEGDSQKILNDTFFKTNFPNGLDFVFIDGDHSYDGSIFDLNSVLPYLNPKGIIFVDDFMSGPPNGVHLPSVNRAVYNFLLKNHLVFKRWHKDGKGIANIKRPNSVLKRFQTLVIVIYSILLRKIKIICSIIKCFPKSVFRHSWRR